MIGEQDSQLHLPYDNSQGYSEAITFVVNQLPRVD